MSASSELDRLCAGELRAVIARSDGTVTADVDMAGTVVLAGSFNPLHRGHRRMLDAASEISGRRGVFEISITNVDKPDLPRDELEQRLTQFRGVADVAVTRAALFSDKADLLKTAWFVLGYDTAVRLVDDSYYPDGDDLRGPAASHLGELQAMGVRFMVAGRVGSDGKFRGLADIKIPADLKEMFIDIPEDRFREDISSTALRQEQ